MPRSTERLRKFRNERSEIGLSSAAVLPYAVNMIPFTFILMAWPQIVTFLPENM